MVGMVRIMAEEIAHHALHDLFKEDPALFARAAHRVMGINMPVPSVVTELNTDCSEFVLKRTVDTALQIDPGPDQHILLAEAQSEQDELKKDSWPYYIAFFFTKFKCQVTLVVLCYKSSTGRWAAETRRRPPPYSRCWRPPWALSTLRPPLISRNILKPGLVKPTPALLGGPS